MLVLAGIFILFLVACSSVKAQKGPLRDDDWADPGDGFDPGSGDVMVM
jgi:hypothetical protein